MLQKFDKIPTKGYKLIDFGSHWEMHSSNGVFRGSFKQVCTYAATDLGFSLDEIDIAVQEMEKYFHNAAEFGVFRKFMFTFDREVSKRKSC